MGDADKPDRHRLDKWLWHARLFKTRSAAAQAVTGGKIKVEGERIKPAHAVRIAESLTVATPDGPMDLTVLALPVRRGPAAEAQTCYAETPASRERRQNFRTQRQLAEQYLPHAEHRPDKRQRRQLKKLRRGQG